MSQFPTRLDSTSDKIIRFWSIMVYHKVSSRAWAKNRSLAECNFCWTKLAEWVVLRVFSFVDEVVLLLLLFSPVEVVAVVVFSCAVVDPSAVVAGKREWFVDDTGVNDANPFCCWWCFVGVDEVLPDDAWLVLLKMERLFAKLMENLVILEILASDCQTNPLLARTQLIQSSLSASGSSCPRIGFRSL